MEVCAIYSIQFAPMNCLLLGSATETVSQIKGVCDIRHAVHSDEPFALRRTETVQYIKMCVIRDKQVCNQKCVRRLIIT